MQSIASRRLQNLAAICLAGDGALAVVYPSRQARLWWGGPEPWKRLMNAFDRNPQMTRILAAAEIALGVWWASRLVAAHEQNER